jgi:hypothetical protein
MVIMRTTIELFEEDERELARTVELMREKRATVLRLAIRAGLPLVVARFQAPRPEGYFADAYKKPDPERERLERAARSHGHPKTKSCYAWSHLDGEHDERTRFVAVLEIPPVESAETAVRLQIVKDFKG